MVGAISPRLDHIAPKGYYDRFREGRKEFSVMEEKTRMIPATMPLAVGVLVLQIIVGSLSARAQTFSVLHTFKGAPDGGNPTASLILDSGGNLLGTAENGGAVDCLYDGCGVVFKLDASGSETILHRFKKGPLGGGALPRGSLLQDAQGNLYGTTFGGGKVNCRSPGCGAVFKLNKSGKETVLWYFNDVKHGDRPAGGLVQDSDGNFYGTASGGLCDGCGALFAISPTNQYSILHFFRGGFDGSGPVGTLVWNSKGTLYGATSEGGGTSCGGLGCGVVFSVNLHRKERVLYRFPGGTDGAFPLAGLIRDTGGNLYGTTLNGGGTGCGGSGCGTVFKLGPDGKETVMHAFGGGTDGAFPQASVIRDSKGNLYGTTSEGGGAGCGGLGCGTVFKLDRTGTETVLYRFTGESDGSIPKASLLLDASGNLYGTTVDGGGNICGSRQCGVVFKITL